MCNQFINCENREAERQRWRNEYVEMHSTVVKKINERSTRFKWDSKAADKAPQKELAEAQAHVLSSRRTVRV